MEKNSKNIKKSYKINFSNWIFGNIDDLNRIKDFPNYLKLKKDLNKIN